MTGVQTCALPICFPVTINRTLENFQEQARLGAMKIVELKKKQDELGESKVGSAEWVKLQVQIEQVETQL